MQLLHPAYEPVYRTALEKTDLMEKIGSPICCWAKTGTPEFQDSRNIMPDGGDKRDRTADLLNAILYGWKHNEYS